ncbi:MAG TPA: hypothetical protein VFB29_13335 [Pseudolabrys sp.]|nr:hypothetical protein [Pseudolabrys sp.]
MRRRTIITAALVVAISAAAQAADRPDGGAYAPPSAPYGARIEPIIVYDYQPGVILRSYWWAPWQNRHYFPKTGKRPKVGRLEHASAHETRGAEDYFRYWSVSSVFAPELPPPPPVLPYAIEPPASLGQPK